MIKYELISPPRKHLVSYKGWQNVPLVGTYFVKLLDTWEQVWGMFLVCHLEDIGYCLKQIIIYSVYFYLQNNGMLICTTYYWQLLSANLFLSPEVEMGKNVKKVAKIGLLQIIKTFKKKFLSCFRHEHAFLIRTFACMK